MDRAVRWGELVPGLWRAALTASVASCALTACGGGGGVGSTPTPTASPSSPGSNSSLDALGVNQAFTTVAASERASFDTAKNVVINGSGALSSVQVSYDAASKSYTVATVGRSATFGLAAVQTAGQPGETRYVRSTSDGRDNLTLVVTPYTGHTPNKYVGLGYWQRSAVSGSTQNTTFDSFVYGFDTPPTGVPRSGSAGYVVDAFGLVTTPGKEPKAFSGTGTFDVDFLRGVFQTKALVAEYSLASDTYGSGGTILLQGAGQVAAGNDFSGNVSYTGFDGTVAGRMSGRFFGPTAQELGGSFAADSVGGGAVTGSLTGQLKSGAAVTLTVDNVVTDTAFGERFAEFSTASDTALFPVARGSMGYNGEEPGKLTVRKDGTVLLRLANSSTLEATFAATDRSSSQRANFTSYDTIVPADGLTASGPVHFDLYRPGTGNTELALTYLGFGIWTRPFQNGTFSLTRKNFLVYGLETQAGLLSRRSGTASYAGVVYGATSAASGAVQDVGGTSRFDVDFAAQKYAGSLDLTAQPATGGTGSFLGTWTFANALTAGQMDQTPLVKEGAPNGNALPYNSITPRFYGPDGEEIGATFTIQRGFPGDSGTTAITGVTVAKRR
jgi:hypothetical protein